MPPENVMEGRRVEMRLFFGCPIRNSEIDGDTCRLLGRHTYCSSEIIDRSAQGRDDEERKFKRANSINFAESIYLSIAYCTLTGSASDH
jgi:hypothetical protein